MCAVVLGEGPRTLPTPPYRRPPPVRDHRAGVFFPMVMGAEEHDFLVAAPGDPPGLLRCPQPQRARRLAVRAHPQERCSWGARRHLATIFCSLLGAGGLGGLKVFYYPGGARALARRSSWTFKRGYFVGFALKNIFFEDLLL